MKDRAIEIMEFLAEAGWDGAVPAPLAADFSIRRFARLEQGARHAILMDADPDQKTDKFVALAGALRGFDLSSPEIYASATTQGLVLMEDFGDRNLGRMLDADENALPLYRRAVDVVVHLHQRFDKAALGKIELPVFDSALFAKQAELFLNAWFLLEKKRAATAEETEGFRLVWTAALRPIDRLPQTLMLRDFMPDNLMDLSDRADWRSVGLLDFQDGGIGPVAYDLASLCETVRRDSPATLMDDMIDYYCEKTAPQISKNELRNACRILAAQRHTRILGIIANRALKTGRRDKLAYAPRIWNYLDRLLQDVALLPVQEWMSRHFPATARDRVA